ncbi:acyltransferase [Mediterraneibacter glycyrrhizinilyticus]|uniref:acyltransferase n=1 Tax=Mediterraneibacter glycyrrhizinilyticus TaxID=342942 RepID=UPI0025A4AFE4|nr:acyltransferase [Mediterraneibacter glycyrrhizinilyticus]MDM8125949.1 acyltransferase [Mediterraneibacter glycyrrhizinilyticus]
MIWEAIKRIWCYTWGQLLALLFYDKKYLTGEWFEGKYAKIFAPGWKWVYHDGWDRLFKGANKGVPWPVSSSVKVIGWENIEFHPDDLRNFQGLGVYYQAMDSHISIGRGTWIAAGVGIIASNHDTCDPDNRQPGKPVSIGEKSWIGMNAVILPGVTLGPHTTVGAGAIVTKSFPEGNCVIAGNPAKIIKYINQTEK